MPSQPQRASGLLRVSIATLFFGLAGVLGKLSGLPAPVVTLGRVLFAGITLAIAVAAGRVSMRPRSRRDLGLLVTQGVILACHWTAFFQSIAVSSVAIGLLSFSSFPLFTAALEPLILKQRPRGIEVTAGLLILPGVYLLAPGFMASNHATAGVVWGLLAAATFALLSVINRGLAQRYHPVTISLYQDGIALVALVPSLAFFPIRMALNARDALILLALGVVCTALAHTLFIAGLQRVRAQVASLIAALEPVWGIAFAYLLLGEIPSASALLGGALILGASLLPSVVAPRSPAQRDSIAPAPTSERPADHG